jgi:hypothetical protein
MKYYRNCPKCLGEISYNHKSDRTKAEKDNTSCKKCMTNSGQFKKGCQTINTKSFYDCWVTNYGKQQADLKLTFHKKKQSFNNKGSKNSMYGKPSPTGAGNGWSGWYKNWYFRSLLELSYVIKVIEKNNSIWKTAECKELTINYKIGEVSRTYRADFLVDNKYLIECKPKKLWTTVENTCKKEAAEVFCKANNLEFSFVEIEKLSTEEIISLYKENKIKFLNRYEIKFKTKYGSLLE